MNNRFTSTFTYRLIYIFRINNKSHDGVLKIGSATVHTDLPLDTLTPNCRELNQAAKKRINDYTSTAGIVYDLLHTELAVYKDGDRIKAFLDKKVHEVLLRSGIKKEHFETDRKQNEWFRTDLDSAKNAITAVKEGRMCLGQSEITQGKSPIVFRPEQKEAIEKTIALFKKNNRVLWNAKMRFGKTLSALEVAKRMNAHKTIIFTHRPVVSDGWFEDFSKIFYATDDFLFGSKHKEKGIPLEKLERSGKSYVYFASIQDLRGSDSVGGKFDKNTAVFDTNWDYVIIDEAHEGTKTELGDTIKIKLVGENTKVLELSGTPFNLLEDYDEKDIYTWDYVMEQRAKREWDNIHFGDSNPYEELPELNIFTYSLGKHFANSQYIDLEDKAFNFKEFFRTWTGDIRNDRKHLPQGVEVGEFVHKDDILSFLNLITKSDKESNYPFSTEKYRDYFRHSLWMVPGVKEAKALSTMMRQHPVFGSGLFEIVNVAGDGDEEQQTKDALAAVKEAIGKQPDTNYSITLSCGRLTTGVSVPEWTAVFMLSGSYATSATNYLQTIFRVQTPANIGGKLKEKCYVFDFAPDRTLKMIAEASKISSKAGQTSTDDRKAIGEFLNFCPVISIEGTKMQKYDENQMLQQLKKAYTDRVVKNGFDDNHIYNDELLKLDGLALDDFKALKEIVGASKQAKKSGNIDVNNQGLTDEEYEKVEQINKKPKKELTETDRKFLEGVKEKRKNRDTAISILRGISIRIPLLVYGADIPFEKEITTENFTKLVDPLSWEEFMPRGVTKELFKKFTRYYDADIFISAARQIRNLAKSADSLPPTERVKKISALFATFKNPDKETVLTPWRVVNMHLGDCLGGYAFLNEQYTENIDEPRYIDHGEVTAQTVSNVEARILEINSKTGLYPLYVTYSIFRKKCDAFDANELSPELEAELWNKTVAENIYVICKTKMARSITKRTLVGYTTSPFNAHAFDDLLNQISGSKADSFIEKIKRGSTFRGNNTEKDMKFNAVVGNPPYQITKEGTSDNPVYHLFMDVAFKLSNKVSLITPARFLFNAGKTPKEWNSRILNDKHFRVIWYKSRSADIFPNVDIKGGVTVTLRDQEQIFGKIGTYTSFPELNSILQKVVDYNDFTSISEIIHPQNKFSLANLYLDFPHYKDIVGSDGKEKRLTTSIFEQLDVFSEESLNDNSISILGLIKNIRMYRYISSKYIESHENLRKYKVLVPKSNGSGTLGEVLSTPLIGEPLTGYTQSFISIGSFETRKESESAIKYVRSKFSRVMLGVLKVTQDNSREVWKYVPLQNFTENSDIDWSKPIKDIDKQLYAKYGLNENEIAFIESTIKPMEQNEE